LVWGCEQAVNAVSARSRAVERISISGNEQLKY